MVKIHLNSIIQKLYCPRRSLTETADMSFLVLGYCGVKPEANSMQIENLDGIVAD